MEFEYGYGYVLGCMETMGVWNLSMDIWFRTLYLVYSLGLGNS